MSPRYVGRHRGHSRSISLPAPSGMVAGGASAAVAASLAFGIAPAQAAPAAAAVSAAVPAQTVAATVPASVVSLRPATVTTISGTVRFGHRGQNVRVVQAKVGVTADGVFGAQTLAAVKRFQSANGLTPDGIVGPKTIAAMGLTRAAAPASTGTTASAPVSGTITGTIRFGMRGDSVRLVQRAAGVSADGVFGRQTLAAVQSFQRSRGLTPDGIVGAKTAAAMGLTRVAGTATTSTSTQAASRSTTRTPIASNSGIMNTARSLLGIPYRYGGTTTAGFDCSGFTQYVFARNGISLPRTTEAQRRATTRVSNPQPGDLVFFGIPATHVGIYAGNGQLIDSGRAGLNTMQRNIWSGNVTYHRP